MKHGGSQPPRAAWRGVFHQARWTSIWACVALMASGCAASKTASSPPSASPAKTSTTPAPRYSDEDAAQELGFSNAPSQRIRARRRTAQHKSMPLHGAQTQPCAFEDCDISDEDDPL